MREGYAVGSVQLVEVDLIIADARPDGHHGAYQLAVSAWRERRRRQFVPSLLGFVVNGYYQTEKGPKAPKIPLAAGNPQP